MSAPRKVTRESNASKRFINTISLTLVTAYNGGGAPLSSRDLLQ